jgi:poly(hydroxyalkanoate) depolymerase family esterase
MSLPPLLITLALGMLAACAMQARDAGGGAVSPSGLFEAGEHGGGSQALSYRLYRPAAAPPTAAGHPLLVMLHGCTQDADDFAAGTRMNRLAEENSFLVVYPIQPVGEHPQKCWNWYEPAHQVRGGGEPARIAALVQELIRTEAVDPSRVYIAGVSAGGAMSLTLAAHYPELFAAVGVHSAIAVGAASGVQEALLAMRDGPAEGRAEADAILAAMGARARVVPLILFHGAADQVVAAANAERLESQWAEAAVRLVDGAGRATTATSHREIGGRVAHHRVTRFGRQTLVESWLVEGLGHAWSGGSNDGTYADPAGPDASAEMMRFFLAHPRAGS